MRFSTYHKILRTSALTLALVLLFVSGVFTETSRLLSQHTGQYLANAVGVNATIKPNELNQITTALTKQKQQLAEREAALEEREIAVSLNSGSASSADSPMIYLLSAILFVLLVLIILNYALDYARLAKQTQRLRAQ